MEILSTKFKFDENLTRITGTLFEDPWTFIIISHRILFRVRNVADKICKKKNQNTHFMFNNFFFLKSVPFMAYVEKCGRVRAGRRWQYNTVRVLSMLDNQGCGYTLRICNFLLLHDNNSYANAPQCYLCMYAASLV